MLTKIRETLSLPRVRRAAVAAGALLALWAAAPKDEARPSRVDFSLK